MERVYQGEFDYEAGIGFASKCDIEVWRGADGEGIVVAYERDDNPGVSVTNACEVIAAEACKRFSIQPIMLRYFERYSYYPAGEYHEVRFGKIAFSGNDCELRYPRWKISSISEIVKLLGGYNA